MSQKVFRDPLYNYIGFDLPRDKWLLDVIDCAEFQRLRRIHQLGVSYLTYPGADHNRLCHSLGVLHLMQQAVQHLMRSFKNSELEHAVPSLLAAALVHDVGHGPFSHLFEPCLGIDHEVWSQRIILDADLKEWEEALRTMVSGHSHYTNVESYCLRDELKAKYHQPYFPEKESDEQSVKNAIRVRVSEGHPIEVSQLLPRLKPLTQVPIKPVRYYVPSELVDEAKNLRRNWKPHSSDSSQSEINNAE